MLLNFREHKTGILLWGVLNGICLGRAGKWPFEDNSLQYPLLIEKERKVCTEQLFQLHGIDRCQILHLNEK